MDSQLSKNNDKALAKIIYDTGWRQGSVFTPTVAISEALSPIIDKNQELLIITSQSCSVVSERFRNDPLVEVMAVKQLPKYNPAAYEAIGKNQRIIHLPLKTNNICQALECNINQRGFIDRKILLNISPNKNFILDIRESEKLAAWLGRNYTRTALPNSLGSSAGGLIKIIEGILKKSYEDSTFHANVSHIYLKWESSLNNTWGELYTLYLIFICKNADISDELDKNLADGLKDFTKPDGNNSISIATLICAPLDEIKLSDLEGYQRFSEYDYFTSFDEIFDYQ